MPNLGSHFLENIKPFTMMKIIVAFLALVASASAFAPVQQAAGM
jgi:hypothetical protein